MATLSSIKMTKSDLLAALMSKRDALVTQRAEDVKKGEKSIEQLTAAVQLLAKKTGDAPTPNNIDRLQGKLSELSREKRNLAQLNDPRYRSFTANYRQAITAVGYSSEDTLRVGINSDLGRLLGL